MKSVAYDAVNGILYGTTVATNNLYSIDTTNGAATLIGPLGAILMHGLAFDQSTQTLFGTYGDHEGDGLYTINTTTGAATFVGHIGFFFADHRNTVGALAFHPHTNTLFGAISGPDDPLTDGGLITIDVTTGAGTLVANTRQISGLAFHPETNVLYGVHNQGTDALYTLDINTGEATRVGFTGLTDNLGLEFAGFIVPEPDDVSASGLAAIVIILGNRRVSKTSRRTTMGCSRAAKRLFAWQVNSRPAEPRRYVAS